jgi:hypothetical protein
MLVPVYFQVSVHAFAISAGAHLTPLQLAMQSMAFYRAATFEALYYPLDILYQLTFLQNYTNTY